MAGRYAIDGWMLYGKWNVPERSTNITNDCCGLAPSSMWCDQYSIFSRDITFYNLDMHIYSRKDKSKISLSIQWDWNKWMSHRLRIPRRDQWPLAKNCVIEVTYHSRVEYGMDTSRVNWIAQIRVMWSVLKAIYQWKISEMFNQIMIVWFILPLNMEGVILITF